MKSLNRAQVHVDTAKTVYQKNTPAGVALAAQIAAKRKAFNEAQADYEKE